MGFCVKCDMELGEGQECPVCRFDRLKAERDEALQRNERLQKVIEEGICKPCPKGPGLSCHSPCPVYKALHYPLEVSKSDGEGA